MRTPFLVLAAMLQTVAVVLKRRPTAMLGMGGFVAGPGGLVAWLLRRPLLIHEANALAGFTNRILARLADRVMTGFPDTFAAAIRAEWVGNPVRTEIAAIAPPRQRLDGRSGPLRLLVVGGSQGARALNQLLPAALAHQAPIARPQVWHQAGRDNASAVAEAYTRHGVTAQVSEFIEDMADALAWSDLVVCRAGAMTVAEVCAAGAAALFVPFPHAVGDHQTANARHLADRQAALLVAERDLQADALADRLTDLAQNRHRLHELAQRARELARPDATRRVADICLEAMRA